MIASNYKLMNDDESNSGVPKAGLSNEDIPPMIIASYVSVVSIHHRNCCTFGSYRNKFYYNISGFSCQAVLLCRVVCLPSYLQNSNGTGPTKPSINHATVVIFLEFFAWGLLTGPGISVCITTFFSCQKCVPLVVRCTCIACARLLVCAVALKQW